MVNNAFRNRFGSSVARASISCRAICESYLGPRSIMAFTGTIKKFFANKDRLARLKRLVQSNDNRLDLDRKIIAVIVRSEQPDFFSVLITTLAELDPSDLDALLRWRR